MQKANKKLRVQSNSRYFRHNLRCNNISRPVHNPLPPHDPLPQNLEGRDPQPTGLTPQIYRVVTCLSRSYKDRR